MFSFFTVTPVAIKSPPLNYNGTSSIGYNNLNRPMEYAHAYNGSSSSSNNGGNLRRYVSGTGRPFAAIRNESMPQLLVSPTLATPKQIRNKSRKSVTQVDLF